MGTVLAVSRFLLESNGKQITIVVMATETPNRYLLSDVVVCRELGISQRTLQRQLLAGKIQAPVGKIAKNRRGWSRAEIDYLREQIAGVVDELTETAAQ